MLFYAVGESFQSLAVKRAKSNIKSLLDQRPDTVTVVENNQPIVKKAMTVSVGKLSN
jgi:Cd2+/Zn2+-exporting ATPase